MQINKETECEVVKKKLSKTQEKWVQHFNNKGEKMISVPDIYSVAKKESKSLIESLKQDFKDSWIVTSTRIVYNKKSLHAKIIHDAGSNVVKPKQIKIKVPVMGGEVGHDIDIATYLQALFDTKDRISEILKVLKRFDKNRKLYLWTPSQSSRANKQTRSVDLCFSDLVRFVVGGDYWFGSDLGFSRGVVVKSAKQTKKSRGAKK